MSPDRRGSKDPREGEPPRIGLFSASRPSRFSASWRSTSDQSRVFLLTAVVAVDKLITVALGLADLVALLAVVEAGIVLVLVVPRWRWRRLGRARDRDIANRSYAATSHGTARSVMIVWCAILSVLRSVLVFLGRAISRVVVLG